LYLFRPWKVKPFYSHPHFPRTLLKILRTGLCCICGRSRDKTTCRAMLAAIADENTEMILVP